MKTPKDQLQQWFQYLQAFQIACEQTDTDVHREDLLTFANDRISSDLATSNEQNQFLITAQNSTGLIITPADLAGSSTFESLLETVWNPLSVYVAAFVRSCTPAPFTSMPFKELFTQSLATVFPGGVANLNWNQLQKGLTSSIPAACYSAKQQKTTNSLLTTAKKTVHDLVDLVSKMG